MITFGVNGFRIPHKITSIYKVWAYKRISDYSQQQPSGFSQKEVVSCFSSIWKTIEHLYHEERFWMLVITETYNYNTPQPDKPLNSKIFLEKFMWQTGQLNDYL